MAQIRYNIKYKLEMKTKLSNKTKKELFFRVLCFLENKKIFLFFNLKYTNQQMLITSP